MLTSITSHPHSATTIKSHGSESRTAPGYKPVESQAQQSLASATQGIGLDAGSILSNVNAEAATAGNRTILQTLALAVAARLNITRRSDETLEALFLRIASALDELPDTVRADLEAKTGLKALKIQIADLINALRQPDGALAARLSAMVEAPQATPQRTAAAAAIISYMQQDTGGARAAETLAMGTQARHNSEGIGLFSSNNLPAAENEPVPGDARMLQNQLKVLFEPGVAETRIEIASKVEEPKSLFLGATFETAEDPAPAASGNTEIVETAPDAQMELRGNEAGTIPDEGDAPATSRQAAIAGDKSNDNTPRRESIIGPDKTAVAQERVSSQDRTPQQVDQTQQYKMADEPEEQPRSAVGRQTEARATQPEQRLLPRQEGQQPSAGTRAQVEAGIERSERTDRIAHTETGERRIQIQPTIVYERVPLQRSDAREPARQPEAAPREQADKGSNGRLHDETVRSIPKADVAAPKADAIPRATAIAHNSRPVDVDRTTHAAVVTVDHVAPFKSTASDMTIVVVDDRRAPTEDNGIAAERTPTIQSPRQDSTRGDGKASNRAGAEDATMSDRTVPARATVVEDRNSKDRNLKTAADALRGETVEPNRPDPDERQADALPVRRMTLAANETPLTRQISRTEPDLPSQQRMHGKPGAERAGGEREQPAEQGRQTPAPAQNGLRPTAEAQLRAIARDIVAERLADAVRANDNAAHDDHRVQTLLFLKGFSEMPADAAGPDAARTSQGPANAALRPRALSQDQAGGIAGQSDTRQEIVAQPGPRFGRENVPVGFGPPQPRQEEPHTESRRVASAQHEQAPAAVAQANDAEQASAAKAGQRPDGVAFAYTSQQPARETFQTKASNERRDREDEQENDGGQEAGEDPDQRRERLARKAIDDLLRPEPDTEPAMKITRDSSESDRAYALYQRMGGF